MSSINRFYPKASKKEASLLKKDIKRCYYKYLTTSDEYFLFDFHKNKSPHYRASFLTDNFKIRCLLKTISEEKYVNDLSDKYNFYKIASPFFGRSAMCVDSSTIFNNFEIFTSEHFDLFIKPLSDSFGRGARVVVLKSAKEIKELFDELTSYGTWIVEERIHQCEETMQWNTSSVNTVRLPCFLSNGNFYVLGPFFRTGRKGAVVDNAGGGGIFACINPQTGEIVSDGVDEMNRYYERHPDSGLVFKGWRVPRWDELLALAEKVFTQCFHTHRYIGFDFALTDKGWVLIEGNWGQFVGQYNDKQGVKEEFVRYLNS